MTATLNRLSPEQAQRVFRTVLDGLSEPGTVRQLPAIPEIPSVLLPMLALADLHTSFHCLGGADWTELVRTLTSATETELGEARLVAALRPVSAEELARLHRGTPLVPEQGALAALPVPELEHGTPLRLSGPGVPGALEFAPSGLPEDFRTARRGVTEGFPAGADLLLITPSGALAGLPRTTRIEEC